MRQFVPSKVQLRALCLPSWDGCYSGLVRDRGKLPRVPASKVHFSGRETENRASQHGDKVPTGPDWIYEIKRDGSRLFIQRDGKQVRLFTRNGHHWTDRYALIVEPRCETASNRFDIDGAIRSRLIPMPASWGMVSSGGAVGRDYASGERPRCRTRLRRFLPWATGSGTCTAHDSSHA
jgi:hypothetical protein